MCKRKMKKIKRVLTFLLCVILCLSMILTEYVTYAWEMPVSDSNKQNNRNIESTDGVTAEVLDDMSFVGTDTFGTMLQNEIEDVTEEQEENNGYNIFSVEINGNVATVDYETKQDCDIVIAIYDNECTQMLTSVSGKVLAGDTLVDISLEQIYIPEFFYIKAYLVETNSLRPLCTEFESNLYTQDMQNFLAKTPEDFDEDKVLEVEPESNSFVVFNDTTKVIPYNQSYNIIEKNDNINLEYIIANPDENFCALQNGDVFSYEYEEGKVLVVEIANIEMIDNKLHITGSDMEMEDVFDYVRIDSDFNNSDSTVDPTTTDEGVEYLGAKEVEIEEQSEAVPLNGASNNGAEVGKAYQHSFNIKKGKSSDGTFSFDGSIDFVANGTIKVYKQKGAEYIECKIEVTITPHLTMKAKKDRTYIKLGQVTFVPVAGIEIKFTPKLVVQVDAEVYLDASIKFVFGIKANEKLKVKNISKKPDIKLHLNIKGEVYVGLQFTPEFNLLDENIFNLQINADLGARLVFENLKITTSSEKGVKHDCTVCTEGELFGVVKLTGEVQLFGVDWFDFDIKFIDKEFKIGNGYISNKGFGLSKCPHLTYKVTVTVTDGNNNPFVGATVCDKYTTNSKGVAEFYLKRGDYNLTVEKDGYLLLGKSMGKFTVKDKPITGYASLIPDTRVKINETTFPDTNFRQYVLDNFDKDKDGALSNTEIENTTEILCGNMGISDLTGVNYFYNLGTLSFPYNSVSTLDVSKLSKLKVLVCFNNNLRALNIGNCKNLETLNLYGNFVTSLDVSGCGKLILLWCHNNKLNTLDVSNCLNLVNLSCNNNNMNELDVRKCTLLKSLGCSDNNINELDLSNCTSLTNLEVSSNNLNKLDVTNCTKLDYIGCMDNNLRTLDVSKCTMLESIQCNNNNLSSLDVSNCSKLKRIQCDAGVNVVGKNANISVTYVPTTSTANLLNNTGDISLHETVDESVVIDETEQNYSTYQSAITASSQTIHQVTTADDNHIDYTDLYPNEMYNLYVVKESADDIPFGEDVLTSNNLLYIRQYTSDSNGELSIDYLPIEEYENATEILVCSKRRNISEGYEIRISNLIYTGEEQTPTIEVKYGEELLTEGKDYELEGDFYVTDIGDYTVSIKGIGIYEGSVDIGYSVLAPVVNVELIELTTTELSLEKGENQIIAYTVSPAGATDKTLTWSSSDETVAKVDSPGKVTALKAGTVTITATANDGSGVSATCTVTVTEPVIDEPDEPTTEEPKPDQPKSYPTINTSYRTHIQSFGWEGNASDIKTWKSNGTMSGTSGKAKRLEGINIVVNSAEAGKDVDLGIQYTTHCQSYGWLPWSADGDMNGTEGEAKRLEAIKIQLTGADKDAYDVYYRVHAQSYGWLNWAKNGAPSGTAGYGKRLEGIQIVVVKKGESFNQKMEGITSVRSESYIAKEGSSPIVNYAPTSNTNPVIPGADTPNVAYRTHVQSFGWQGWKYNGQMSGTSGLAKRLEGININLTNKPCDGDIVYTTHVQTYGWKDGKPEDTTRASWKKNGAMSGTSGEAKRLEAICIDLTGEMGEKYDIYYRVHAQSFGWLGWAKNGEESGTAGYAKRLEGIQIVLVPAGGTAPADDFGGVISNRTEAYIAK